MAGCRRKLALAFFTIYFLLFAFAVRSPAATTANQLLITFGSLSEREAVIFVAKDYGIFPKHGLDVRAVHVRNGAVALSALANGSTPSSLGNSDCKQNAKIV